MVDDVLQTDADPVQQAVRGRKTVAYADCTEVQVGEKPCFAEGEEAEIEI